MTIKKKIGVVIIAILIFFTGIQVHAVWENQTAIDIDAEVSRIEALLDNYDDLETNYNSCKVDYNECVTERDICKTERSDYQEYLEELLKRLKQIG